MPSIADRNDPTGDRRRFKPRFTTEIDATAADVSPKVLTKCERGLLNPAAGTVVEGKDLPDPAKTKVRGYGEERRPIREVAMDQNDGPLTRLAQGAATGLLDPERKERGCCGNAEGLLCDQTPCRSCGCRIVLDHRVPQELWNGVAVPPNATELYQRSIEMRCGRSAAAP